MRPIRGRFAPSPSGEMHLGNAWTALLAWLQVRSLGGTMVLRIEDLDPDRSRQEYAEQLMRDMQWLGLDWDEGPDVGGEYTPYCQDARRPFYEQALTWLEDRNLIYPCYCSRAELRMLASAPHAGEEGGVYPGTCLQFTKEQVAEKLRQGRKPSLRIKAQSEDICFTDLVYGTRCENVAAACGDFVVRRSDGVHAYQLAVVVDDAMMHITHVVRGDDLLPSTARQIMLHHLLGYKTPEYAHVPLLYGMDGYRLSKRHGALSIAALKKQGVTPECIIGFLAAKAGLCKPGEHMKAVELVEHFDIKKIPKEGIQVAPAEVWT